MDFSPVQIGIVLVIALLVFGPRRLPELGSSLGRGIREFKDSLTAHHDDDTAQLGSGVDATPDSETVTEPKS